MAYSFTQFMGTRPTSTQTHSPLTSRQRHNSKLKRLTFQTLELDKAVPLPQSLPPSIPRPCRLGFAHSLSQPLSASFSVFGFTELPSTDHRRRHHCRWSRRRRRQSRRSAVVAAESPIAAGSGNMLCIFPPFLCPPIYVVWLWCYGARQSTLLRRHH